MTASTHPTRLRRTAARLRRTALATGALGLTLGLALASAVPLTGPASAATGGDQPPTSAPTRVRIATFNLLGYGHTMKGGDRRGFSDGVTRQKMADQLIRSNGLEIVGFQEMEWPQINQFKTEMGGSYDIFPGRTDSDYRVNVDGNSIAWRKDRWTAVETSFYDAPYFGGTNVPKPIVLLRNNITGQELYVTNTHNPANTKGDAQQYRDRSVDIQAGVVNALHSKRPAVPVVFTGDMNDTRDFYCRITRRTTLEAANGGSNDGRTCRLPSSPQIDWILGSPSIVWDRYRQLRTAYVKKTTDHPLVFADAVLQPVAAQRAGIRRVVVLDVEGLPSSALGRLTPQLDRMRAQGASTLNARTAAESTRPLPNLVSLLSGRPVGGRYGGHRVTWATDQPSSKRRRVAHGVRSLFDSVHDFGGSTSFMSSDRSAALVQRTYDARHGAPDRQGVDHGRAKLSVTSLRPSDKAAVAVLRQQLRTRPRTVSVVQLSGLREVGQRSGFSSAAYRTALRNLDRRVGQVLSTIRGDADLAHSTLVVLTSDSGGARHKVGGRSLRFTRVPFLVWGSGVPGGTDLYRLNPAYRDPGSGRPGYTGPQPIRVADVADLVTGVLGYPAVPGSRTRPRQDFNVFRLP